MNKKYNYRRAKCCYNCDFSEYQGDRLYCRVQQGNVVEWKKCDIHHSDTIDNVSDLPIDNEQPDHNPTDRDNNLES